MAQHQLSLASEPFNAIISGKKVIESRLFDQKRQSIRIGDRITFINRDEPSRTVDVKIVKLLRYDSFADMFTNNDPALFGGPSVDWLLDQIHAFYSQADQKKFGVVGIQFVVL
jgi:ASC-1-like (ASCH) protein